MNKIQTVLVKVSLLSFLLLLISPTFATAVHYKQPAFISNFYFTYTFSQGDKGKKQDLIINSLMINSQPEVQLIVDLVGNKGTHNIEMDILDMKGKSATNTLKFDPWTALDDDMFFNIKTTLAGNFPEGGVFFKVYDILDNGERTLIGTFRMMTVK